MGYIMVTLRYLPAALDYKKYYSCIWLQDVSVLKIKRVGVAVELFFSLELTFFSKKTDELRITRFLWHFLSSWWVGYDSMKKNVAWNFKVQVDFVATFFFADLHRSRGVA